MPPKNEKPIRSVSIEVAAKERKSIGIAYMNHTSRLIQPSTQARFHGDIRKAVDLGDTPHENLTTRHDQMVFLRVTF